LKPQPSNPILHPTPLRGPKIAAILSAGIGSAALPISFGGASNQVDSPSLVFAPQNVPHLPSKAEA
jgi:hypothetical protein